MKKPTHGGARKGAGRKKGKKTVTLSFRVPEEKAMQMKEQIKSLIKPKKMKKVRFGELDGENKLTAISHMFSFKIKKDWPNGAIWKSEEDIVTDLEQDYNPNEHFSFYENEFGEVETKIG